jgi:GDPmannose 4,6-dehydratase
LPKARLFYASSSRIFSASSKGLQDEKTPIDPDCIYGTTKAAGLFACRMYRNKYSIFASTGILYNHESHLREDKFVSRKIIRGAIDIKKGKRTSLVLGDLSAKIDFGYAPDYVDAMHKILNTAVCDDFIVATGKKHSVLDFVKTAFGYLGLDWKLYVKEDKNIVTRKSPSRAGNARKLRSVTSWKPSVDFREMIRLLLSKEGALDE